MLYYLFLRVAYVIQSLSSAYIPHLIIREVTIEQPYTFIFTIMQLNLYIDKIQSRYC